MSSFYSDALLDGANMVAKSYVCIRHGVTEMNVYLGGCPYGTPGFVDPGLYDTRLTDEGMRVASTELLSALRAAHKEDPIQLVVSSPLTRALKTAELGLGSIEVSDTIANTSRPRRWQGVLAMAFRHIVSLQVPRTVSPLIAERRYLSSDMGRAPSLLVAEFPDFFSCPESQVISARKRLLEGLN